MPERISAAKAHTIVLEELAAYAPGEGFTGSCSEDPAQAYPANLVFVVEQPLPNSTAKSASKWTPDTSEPTGDGIREAVRIAVDAVRQVAAQRQEVES